MVVRGTQGAQFVRDKLKAARNLTDPVFASEYLAEMASRWRDRQLVTNARSGRETCWIESEAQVEPLVTIRIATKDRPQLLLERSVASALRQTYANIEVLVVGDGCDPRTQAALSAVDDERVRYVNLGRPGRYPANPADRWKVAGAAPMNAALLLASGDWLAPCDDDDELTDDHVERLLAHARANALEFVWSKTEVLGDGPNTKVIGRADGREITHGSMIYSMGLSFFLYSPTCYRMQAFLDQNLWTRMRRAGVKMGFLDEVTYRYWPAGVQQYEGN